MEHGSQCFKPPDFRNEYPTSHLRDAIIPSPRVVPFGNGPLVGFLDQAFFD
jgi:hypothetical protein